MNKYLQENLRYLCSEKGSVAQVCRDIGINQQQFSKYLTGRSSPSRHNLRRISRYFNIRDEDLLASPDVLLKTFQRKSRELGNIHDPFFDAFPGELRELRRFIGVYRTYNLSPAVPGNVIIATTVLREHEGIVYSETIDSIYTRLEGARQGSRYEGKAAYHGERIFVMEYEAKNSGSFMMTTLFPPNRYLRKYLFGMTSFIASFPHRMPTSSRTVWELLSTSYLTDEVVKECGKYPLDSSKLGPIVRQFLQDDSLDLSVSLSFDK